MPRAVFLHADGTECHHDGSPATSHLEKLPRCPDQRIISSVSLYGNSHPIELAPVIARLEGAAATFAAGLTDYGPVITALARFAENLTPGLRAIEAFTLAYMAAFNDAAGKTEGTDPCGAGPLPAGTGHGTGW